MTTAGASAHTWASGTGDARALALPGSSSRLAATWYGNSFSVDVNITDGKSLPVSLYFLDWDSTSRVEQIQVIDPSTGAVLDSRTVSAFHGGTYLTWNLSGRTRFVVTKTAGANAVVSGFFFG